MFVLVVCYWLVLRIYNAEATHLDLKILKPDTKGRSVNLALETVVEFDNQDKAENIKFLDNVNKLIGKVKTAITNNNKARHEFRADNVETFTDFVQHAVDELTSYSDKDLEDFFSILNDEVRKYHYRGCKFHELTENYGLRTFLADKLDAARTVKATELRETLAALSEKIEEERYDKFERTLVDFVDSLYSKDSVDNLKKFLNEINDFKANKGSYTDLVNIIKEGLRSTVFNHYTNLNNNARVEFKNKIDEYWDNYSKQLNTHGTDKQHDNNILTKQDVDSLAYFRYPKSHYTSTTKSPKKNVKPLKQVHVEKEKYNPTLFTTTKKETTTKKKLTFMTLYPEFETIWPGVMSETKRPRFKSQFETNKSKLKSEHEQRPKSKLQIEMKLRKWKGKEERNKLDEIQPNIEMNNDHQQHEPYEILLPKRLNQETNTELFGRKQSSEMRAQKRKSTLKKPISIGYLTAEISNTIKKKLAQLNKKLETEHTSKYLQEMPEPKSNRNTENIHFRSHGDTKRENVIDRILNLESELQNVKTQLENDTNLMKNLKNKIKETDSRRIESGMNKYYLFETNIKKTTKKVKDAYLGDFGFNAHIEVEQPKKIYKDIKYDRKEADTLRSTHLKKSNLLGNNYYAKDKNHINVKSNRGKGMKHGLPAKKYSLHNNDDKHHENVYKSHVLSQNDNKYKKYKLHTARERNRNNKKLLNKYENNRNKKYHGDLKTNSVHDLVQDGIKLKHKNNYYMQPWSGQSRSQQYHHSKRREYLKNNNNNKVYKSPDLGRKMYPSTENKYYDERKSEAAIQFVSDTETKSENKNRYNANKKNKYGSNRHAASHNYEKRKEKTTNIAFYRKMIKDDDRRTNRIGNKGNIHEPKPYKDKGNMESNLDKNNKYGRNNEEDSYKRYSAENDVESAEKYNEKEHIDKYSQSSEKEKERKYDTAAGDIKNDIEDLNEISNEIPIEHPSRKHLAEYNAGIEKNYYSVKDMSSNKDDGEKEVNTRNGKKSEEKYENQPSFEQDNNIVVSDSDKHVAIQDVINITTKEVYYTTYPTTIIGRDKSSAYNKQEPFIESQTHHAVNKYDNNEKKLEIHKEISNTNPNTQVSVSELRTHETTKEIVYKTLTEKNTAHDISDNNNDDKIKDIQYAPVSQHINNQTYHDENKNKINEYISDKIIVPNIINGKVSYDNTTPFIKKKYGQDECKKAKPKSSSCTNNELELSKHSLRKDIQYKLDIVKDTEKERLPDSKEHMTKTNLAHTKDDKDINGKVISKTNYEVTSEQYEHMTFGLNKRFKKVSRVDDGNSIQVSDAASQVTDRVKKNKEIKHVGDQSAGKSQDIPTKVNADKDDHVQRTDQRVLPKEMDSNQKYSVRYEKIFDVDDPLFKKTERFYESDKNTATDIKKQNDEKNLQFYITTVSNERKSSTHSTNTYIDRNDEDVIYQSQEKSNTNIHKVNDAYNHNRFTEVTKITPETKMKSYVKQVGNGEHQLTGHKTDKIRVEFKNGEVHISNYSNSNRFKANNDIPDTSKIRDMTDHDSNMFVESNRKSGASVENDNNNNHNNKTFENGMVVGHLKSEISEDVLKALETAAQSHEDINNMLKQDTIANKTNYDFKNAINIDQYYPKSDKNADLAEMNDKKLGYNTNFDKKQTDLRKSVDKGKPDILIRQQKDQITTTKIGYDNKETSNYIAKSNHIEPQGKANRRFSNDFERPGEDKYKGIDKVLRGPKIDQADLEAHMNDIWESMNRTGYTDKIPETPIRMAVADDVVLASDTQPPFLEPQRKVFAPTAPAPLTTKKIDPPTANTDPYFGTLFPQNFDDIEVTEATEQTLSPTDNPLSATNNDDPYEPSNLFNNDLNDEMGPKTGVFVPPVGINNELGKIAGVDSVETLKSKVSDRLNLPKGDLKTGDLNPFWSGIAPLNMGAPPDARRNLLASHTEAHRDVDSKEIFEDPTLKDMDRDMQI